MRVAFSSISLRIVAPQVGLEPTTLRLTAECSAIELLRNKRPHIVERTMCRARSAFYSKWICERQPLTDARNSHRIMCGCSTRQRQLNATPGAGAPFGSHEKTVISTSVPLLINLCITVAKTGFCEIGVARTLIGRLKISFAGQRKLDSLKTTCPLACVCAKPLTSKTLLSVHRLGRATIRLRWVVLLGVSVEIATS